jgi:mannosyltransferase
LEQRSRGTGQVRLDADLVQRGRRPALWGTAILAAGLAWVLQHRQSIFRIGHVQALVGLTVAGAALRFSTLGTQSYWYDEAITVNLVRRSLHEMLAAIPDSESTPPLYYVVAWGWSRLFGTGEVGLRSLSAVLGTATVPAAYVAARAFVSRRSSLVAAAFVAVSPLLVWYSQEARAYALLVLLGTLSLLFFRRAVDRRETKWLTWWAIMSTLAIATHYFAVFLIAAEAAWLALRCPARAELRRAVAVVVLLAAALAPLALYQAFHYHTSWIANSGSLVGRAAYLLHQLVVGVYPVSDIRPIVVAVPVLVLVGLFAWTVQKEREGALLALAIGVAAIAIPFAMALVSDHVFDGRGDYFFYRNLIIATVPLTIPVAAVAGTAHAGKVGLMVCAVVCLLLVGISVDISRRPDLQRPDTRAIAVALGSPRGLRAILLDARTSVALKLYRPRLREMALQSVHLREIEVIEEQDSPTAPQAALSPPRGFRGTKLENVPHGFAIVVLRAANLRRVTRANLAREFPTNREVAILIDPPPSERRSVAHP